MHLIDRVRFLSITLSLSLFTIIGPLAGSSVLPQEKTNAASAPAGAKSTKQEATKSADSKKDKEGKSDSKSADAKASTKRKNYKPQDLVAVQHGELPIIISAPHGGVEKIPNVPERKGEGMKKGGAGFFAGRDGNTEILAREIANQIEAKMGKKPYLVIAKFHRKYLDANRPPEIAYESENAKPVYEVYRGTLGKYCAEVHKNYGRGLFLDIHGQGSANDTIFRGTRNGQTVELLRKRYGESAQVGPKSFFGLLNAKGLKVFPLDDSKERGGFTGGNIVGSYGSHTAFGMDAIQLEFGNDYRKKDNIKATAQKVSDAIVDFAKLYLPEKPLTTEEKADTKKDSAAGSKTDKKK